MVLTSQLTPHLNTGLVDTAARNRGIGASQVDVLKDATGRPGFSEALGPQAVLVDSDELTGLNLPHEGGTDDVESGGF